MFKFGFSKDDLTEDKNENGKAVSLNWQPATEIEILSEWIDEKFDSDYFIETKLFPGVTFNLILTEKVVIDLKTKNFENIVEAESQHSDLVPAKYEGGLKIWECSYDLGKYLLERNISLDKKTTLDLGCGVGIVGLVALFRGAMVHFQDYNDEVIKSVTIPNVLLNLNDRISIRKRCEFYSGDWESFTALSAKKYNDEDKKYDAIFTSETIYNPDNHKKLYQVFKQRLKSNGVGYVAGKTYYFGVGGGMRQFEDLIKEDGVFNVETVWKSVEGVQREILMLTRNTDTES